MKNFIFAVILLLFSAATKAQEGNSDSTQNSISSSTLTSLLHDRQGMMAAYNRSLTAHTGFFGNRSEEDDRNSNTILADVLKTDNELCQNLTQFLHQLAEQQRKFKAAEKKRKEAQLLIADQSQDLDKDRRYEKWLEVAVYGLSAALILLLVLLIRKRRYRVVDWKKV
jgi:hypothetical protein